ncbi:phospholipid methyltransferase [Christiangramia gaetbulicola]|uniref:Phospholipid methyltransferase n=1 Tax=Christiangramia gaetbulicola TaxID=703340 RepID=A0A2T6ALW5_9FLAO|nr:prolipoprotein diacylglyceryl transferase family protein [Christiangramia gaetbulicola]PTX44811.1 phospholipid methyltransferase [Christiangramia gaetbulicola]
MKTPSTFTGKFLYAITFLVVIPLILWLWAIYTEEFISFPAIGSENAGWAFFIGGLLLMIWGMYSLKVYGKGLPMNAYPPAKFVDNGAYLFLAHPIYWGFGILMIGFFMLTHSASGLWLVTPLTILCMIALVMGYETIDLKKRFPDRSISTIFKLPENTKASPDLRERLVSLFLVIASLFLANFLITRVIENDVSSIIEIRLSLPPFTQNEYLPLLGIGYLLLIPFILRSCEVLRHWTLASLLGISIYIFCSFLYPELVAIYLEPYQNLVYIVPIFLLLISLKAIFKTSKILVILFGLFTLMLVILQLSYTYSAVLSLSVSLIIYLCADNYLEIWLFLRHIAEEIANSWDEWTFGNVRIINHGFYVGFGSFLGILISGILVGDFYAWGILIFAIVVIIFSALWAQIIEGSEKLKRPYGYYGALVGIIFASLIVWALGYDVWVLIGVISVVMPWVQAIGRFRCLVNGCCHGKKVNDPNIGIRYYHYRSRVCGISHLKGELLYPTPLYSMIWLFLVGLVLLSLWNNGFSMSFIFGLYLILTSIGRFVEEAYRGEVQTPIVQGLRLYQWTAIISFAIGMIMTCIPVQVVVASSSFGWETILSSVLGGLFTFFAMGVDFPNSNARFSRLV